MSNEAWSRAKRRKYFVIFLFGAMEREANYAQSKVLQYKKKKKKKMK